jgi:hypothetical protein
MSPAGFKPAIPAGERPQIHALDRRRLGSATQLYSVGITHLRKEY